MAAGAVVEGWITRRANFSQPVTIATITDGTSNTAAFSEWVRGDGNNNPVNSKPSLGLILRMTAGRSQL